MNKEDITVPDAMERANEALGKSNVSSTEIELDHESEAFIYLTTDRSMIHGREMVALTEAFGRRFGVGPTDDGEKIELTVDK